MSGSFSFSSFCNHEFWATYYTHSTFPKLTSKPILNHFCVCVFFNRTGRLPRQPAAVHPLEQTWDFCGSIFLDQLLSKLELSTAAIGIDLYIICWALPIPTGSLSGFHECLGFLHRNDEIIYPLSTRVERQPPRFICAICVMIDIHLKVGR